MNYLLSSEIKDPVHFKFAGEDPGEKILYIFRKSLITNIRPILIFIVLLVVPSFFSYYFLTLNEFFRLIFTPQVYFTFIFFWYVFSVGFIFERFLAWYFNVYIITNKRIVDMDYHHILFRRVSEAPLRNIEDITYDMQGAVETMFNFGDVLIQTAGESPEFEFKSVHNPSFVQDKLSDLVKEVKGHA